MHIHTNPLIAPIALYLVASISACSSGPTDSETTTDEQQLGALEASEASSALGIVTWQTNSHTKAMTGLDGSGSVVVAFTVDVDAGLIRTTVPDAGTRSIRNPAESTLSQATTELVDAAEADLRASIDNNDSMPVGDSSDLDKAYLTYACYQYYADCSNMCLYQLYYGYWHACECDYPAAECPTNPWRIALRYN